MAVTIRTHPVRDPWGSFADYLAQVPALPAGVVETWTESYDRQIAERIYGVPMTETAKTVFTPTADRVLVRPTKKQETTAGGIIVPDQHQKRPQRGVVVAVGPGQLVAGANHAYLMTAALKPGDRVLYGKHSGADVNVNGEELLVMRADEVLGVERDASGSQLEERSETDQWTPEQRAAREATGRPVLDATGPEGGPRCSLDVVVPGESEYSSITRRCVGAEGHEPPCR